MAITTVIIKYIPVRLHAGILIIVIIIKPTFMYMLLMMNGKQMDMDLLRTFNF